MPTIVAAIGTTLLTVVAPFGPTIIAVVAIIAIIAVVAIIACFIVVGAVIAGRIILRFGGGGQRGHGGDGGGGAEGDFLEHTLYSFGSTSVGVGGAPQPFPFVDSASLSTDWLEPPLNAPVRRRSWIFKGVARRRRRDQAVIGRASWRVGVWQSVKK